MDMTGLIEQGTANPLLLVAMGTVLGALHGLEPGHSKTMMAAFIVAVRGTVFQAVLLGLSAATSHTVIVWVLALLALTYGERFIGPDLEPWLLTVSGAIVLLIAAWVFLQTRRTRQRPAPHHHHHDQDHKSHVHHSHDQAHGDAHARVHARQIEARFAGGRATNTQVALFGLTGGLLPCPAAITVLILCLHLQKFWLGVGLVGAFSAGLAATLVAVGSAAAWGTAAIAGKSKRIDGLLARAPYLSAALIAVIGIVMLASGLDHLV